MLRWGILSTARIATQKVIPALQAGSRHQVTAIASRSADRAEAAARTLGIDRAHASYEALLADPEVDVVYNPLPNHLHVPWSVRALEAGKHVLCEKPLARSVAEARPLVEAAAQHPHLQVMEAFMYRFHPQWLLTQRWLDGGQIGTLRSVHVTFAYTNLDPANIRNRPDLGGGALLDIGCYAVSVARLAFGREPERVHACLDRDPTFGTDRLTSGLLDFGTGHATFTVSTQADRFQRAFFLGTRGAVEIEIPFNAPPDQPCRLRLTCDGHTEEMRTEPTDQYTAQADHLADAIEHGTPLAISLGDSLATLAVVEQLFAAAPQTSA